MLVSHSLEVSLVAVFQNRRETIFQNLATTSFHDHLPIALDCAAILKVTKHRYTQPRDLKDFENFVIKVTTLR